MDVLKGTGGYPSGNWVPISAAVAPAHTDGRPAPPDIFSEFRLYSADYFFGNSAAFAFVVPAGLFRRRNSVDVATRDGGPLVIEIVRFSDLPSEPREGK